MAILGRAGAVAVPVDPQPDTNLRLFQVPDIVLRGSPETLGRFTQFAVAIFRTPVVNLGFKTYLSYSYSQTSEGWANTSHIRGVISLRNSSAVLHIASEQFDPIACADFQRVKQYRVALDPDLFHLVTAVEVIVYGGEEFTQCR